MRAGLIVGPHDNVFRLPWWVRRIAEGGEVPAPGEASRPLQVIDARDLATWLVRLAEERTSGAFNGTAPVGQTTMGELLQSRRRRHRQRRRRCAGSPRTSSRRRASSRGWSSRCGCRRAISAPGTSAPTSAQAAGLRTRPVAETVADIWNWLQTGGEAELDDWRAEHRPPKMSAEREAALIRLLC